MYLLLICPYVFQFYRKHSRNSEEVSFHEKMGNLALVEPAEEVQEEVTEEKLAVTS
jgi:hypothetical protein